MSVSAVRQQISLARLEGEISISEANAIIGSAKRNVSKKEAAEVNTLLGQIAGEKS